MRQAIVTKYLGPTNTKGSRIVASCQAKRLVFNHWNFAEGHEVNHELAARALAVDMDWAGHWFGGWLPDGSAVWVNEGALPGFRIEAKP